MTDHSPSAPAASPLVSAALALCRSLGFEAGEAPLSSLTFHPEIRAVCEENRCRNYSASWACPPAVGTLEECRERCLRYGHFLLFSRAYALEDSWDFQGMGEAHRDFQLQTDRLDEALGALGLREPPLILSNEGCIRCRRCTWPDAPCRFPEKLHPSLEGFGFLVSELAAAAGLAYRAKNGVACFGAILLPGEAGTGTTE